MALKDWKKDRKNVWKKKEDKGGFIWINQTPSKIYVVEATTSYPLSPKILKRFKKKSQAILFVHNYMKKH